MNPLNVFVSNLPAADPLPMAAPPALFHGLLLLTSVLHLLAMNLLVGGAVLAVVARVRGARGSAPHAELSRAIERVLPALVAAAVSLGVAPLLFVQVLYGRIFFVSSILIGWWWLAVIGLLLVAYSAAYMLAMRKQSSMLTAALVPILLLAIGAILVTNMSLMLWPEQFLARYFADPAGLRPDYGDWTFVPRWLHFMTAAIAVASMALLVWGWARRHADSIFAAVAIRTGTAGFAFATGANVLFGLAWFGLLPRAVVFRFLGDNGLATALFAAAVVLALFTVAASMMLAWTMRPSGGALAAAVASLVATVVCMSLVRDQLRAATLERIGYVYPHAEPQWFVIALFAVFLVLALGTIGWMVRSYASSAAAETRRAAVEHV